MLNPASSLDNLLKRAQKLVSSECWLRNNGRFVELMLSFHLDVTAGGPQELRRQA